MRLLRPFSLLAATCFLVACGPPEDCPTQDSPLTLDELDEWVDDGCEAVALNPGEIRGRLVASSPEGMVGGKVTVVGSLLTVIADAAGRFVMPNMPPGTYRLRGLQDADGNGDAELGMEMTVDLPSSNEGRSGVNVGLMELGTINTIAGTVKKNAEPVGLSFVLLQAAVQAKTNAQGLVALGPALPGTYPMFVFSGTEGWYVGSQVVLSSEKAIFEVDVGTLAPSSTASLTGFIRMVGAGSPAGATVTLTDTSGSVTAVAAADGSFRFADLASGIFNLSVAHTGFQSVPINRIGVAGDTGLPWDIVLIPNN